MRYLYSLIFFFAVATSFGQTSWLRKLGPLGGDVMDVEYYPGTSNVWALVNYQVYKSTDDGATWTQPAVAVLQNNSIYDIEIANNTIYFLAYDQVFTSVDQGVNITSGPQGQFFSGRKIKRMPNSGTLVILTSAGSLDPDIYVSINNGTSWTAGWNGSVVNSEYLAVNSSDQIFILARTGSFYRPYRSADGGITFTEQSGTGGVVTAGVDVFSLNGAPDGSQIACVTSAGIFATTTAATWTSIKGGNITDATIASFGGASFVQYTEDNAGMYFIDNQNSKVYSKTFAGGAGTWALQATDFPVLKNGIIWPAAQTNTVSSANFPAATSRIVYGTSVGIFRSSTGGASNPESSSGIGEVEGQKTIAAVDGSLLMQTYSGGLLRSTNQGDSWSRITTVPQSINTISSVVTGTLPVNGMTQVVLGNDGKVYQSGNSGASFTVATQTGTFSDMQGGDNKRVFAVGIGGVFYSGDGGISFGATPIAFTGLPSSYSIDDIFIPGTTNLIYMRVNNFNNSQTEYYKIQMTYNGGTNAVITAAGTLMTAPPLSPDETIGSNGKLYVYDNNGSSDQLTVYSGTSWSAAVGVPNGNFSIARNNGYIFIAQSNTNPGKISMSRDDGATFVTTNLPSGVSGGNVQDVTVSPDGWAYLTMYHDFMLQGKTKVVLPAAPTGFVEVARTGNVFIFRWTDNAFAESATRVYKSSDGGTSYSLVATIDNSDICGADIGGRGYYTDEDVVPGKAYKYKLRVLNDAGETESVVYSPSAIPALSTPTVPDNRSWTAVNAGGNGWGVQTPQTDICIQSLGNGKYTVSDISINTVSSSDVAQEFYVNGTTTAVGGSATQSTSTDVRANSTNTWNGTNTLKLSWLRCDDPTKFETITYTLNANDPAPAAPVLQAVINSNTNVELTWATINFTKNYVLERSTTSASSGFSQLGTNIAYPSVLVNDNTVVDGTTYFYRLKALNNANVASVYSNVVTIPFKKPNFLVSATAISSYVAATMGTYWADFDGDGNDDLMTVNGTLNGDQLSTVTIFRNLGTGDFEKKSVTLGSEIYSFGAVSDINGDGKADISLAITDKAQVDFYKSNGDFTFTKLTGDDLGALDTSVKSERQGIMWGDINNDGRLDVIISGEYNASLNDKIIVATQNVNGTFSVIDAGDISDYANDSFSTFWIDYNKDGYTDVLIGSDDPMLLYRNNGDNTFTLLGPGESGISTGGFLGLVAADFNNDGFIDIFCGGGEGGSSVIYQNDGDGSFTLKDGTAISSAEAFVVSPAAGDVNNDGLTDLIVPGFFGLPTTMYVNTTVGSTLSFDAVTTEKINDARYWHLGTAFFDYNKDGFLDLAMGSLKNINDSDDQFVDGENYLFENNNTTGNWSEIRLVGVTANKSGLGATITVNTNNGKKYSRYIASSSSFISLNSLTTHFGLGTATSITSVEVLWPSNPVGTQIVTNPAINTILTITQDTYPPAITTRVPAAGATGILTTTKLEITFDETTVAVGGKKITVTATGGGQSALEIDVSTGVISGNKFTYTLPQQLLPNKHYDVAIEAGAFADPFQNKTALINDWGFTTSDADPEAPEFGNVAAVIPATANKSALATAITIPVTDNKGVTKVTLFIKGVSESTFTSIDVPANSILATGFDVTLPATGFDAIGAQYYFKAEDAALNSSLSPADAPATVYKTQVKYTGNDSQVPASLIGSGGSATGWKVIAIPFDLGSNNGVQAVFDELTGNLEKKVKVDYRILTYTETPSPDWQDYPDKFSTIDRGAGYFINIKAPVNIIVGDNIVAPSNTRSNLFKMNLKAGWNMIGNPYLEPINWDDVVAFNSLTGTAATLKKFSGGSYNNATTVAAYEGGFVHMDAAAEVTIPFNGQTGPGRIGKPAFEAGDWLVPITVKQGDVVNSFGGVGMHSQASLTFDVLDDINAPRWFEFLEMNFSHPEHNAKTFARDVVPVADEFVWSFKFDSNIPGATTMTWDNETYSIETDLYLYDEDTQTPVNMKENNSYSFDASVSKNFKVYYGANALSKIKPAKVMLGLAYPNPTSNSTTITFSIPETRGRMNVRLDMFDLTGRKVGTLANGEFESGFYSAQWQALEGANDGMYVYRLVAGDEVLGGKLILRK